VAVALLGMLGGARASRTAGVGAAETKAAEATARKMEVFMIAVWRSTGGKKVEMRLVELVEVEAAAAI
jgi:hypothetical protein